jgi:CheY-specific phosphatase CheX
LPIRAYEIFIFTWISNVKQWKGDQYNGGVSDVVGIAGMVEGSGIMVASSLSLSLEWTLLA